MAKKGRPKKLAKERRTNRFEIVLSASERKQIDAKAEAVGKKPSIWAREVLLREAAK